MKALYDGVALHDIGIVSLMSESSTFEPQDAPQKEIVTLELRIDAWKQTFTDNRAKMQAIQTAIRKPERILKITQLAIPSEPTSTELVLYDQSATVTGDDFPSDINEWGTTHQQIRVKFRLEVHNLSTNSYALTITPQGGGTGVVLGTVFTWKEQIRSELFDESHDTRKRVGGSVEARGEFLGDMSLALENRRQALLTSKEGLLRALDAKNVQLVYGSGASLFNKVVRISDRSVDIDQPNNKVVWQFSATYTRFPNDQGYAIADYEVNQAAARDDGDQRLSITGRIMANSEAVARAKLTSLQTAIVSEGQFNYAAGNLTRNEVRVRRVSSDSTTDAVHTWPGDGEEWIELSFTLEYLKRDPTNLSFKLTIDDQDDTTSGLLRRTYSGSVVCGWAVPGLAPPGGTTDADQAYLTAVKKARQLGANKHPINLGNSLKRDDRQTAAAGTQEFMKLDFSFTYLVRSTRIYMEVNSSTDKQKFGEDSETVNGFVVGDSQSNAYNVYAALRDTYTNIMRNEKTETTEHRLQAGTWPTDPVTTEPGDLWDFAASSGMTGLLYKLTFSFSVFRDKEEGVYAIKAGMRVAKSFTTLVKTTTVEGSLFGTEEIINAALDEEDGNKLDLYFESLQLALPKEQSRGIDLEFDPVVHTGSGSTGAVMKLDFSATFETNIAGDDTILECEVNEKIKFSGARNVVIPIPDREVEVQQLGITEGRRTITGFVVAANETAALGWVKRQKATPFGTQATATGYPAAPTLAYDEPPELDITHNFNPFTDGEIRGSDVTKAPRLVRVSFTFSQILPSYAYTIA